MDYWFEIKGELPESQARDLWSVLAPFNSNLTVLFDCAFVYGKADAETVSLIALCLAGTGLPVERG